MKKSNFLPPVDAESEEGRRDPHDRNFSPGLPPEAGGGPPSIPLGSRAVAQEQQDSFFAPPMDPPSGDAVALTDNAHDIAGGLGAMGTDDEFEFEIAGNDPVPQTETSTYTESGGAAAIQDTGFSVDADAGPAPPEPEVPIEPLMGAPIGEPTERPRREHESSSGKHKTLLILLGLAVLVAGGVAGFIVFQSKAREDELRQDKVNALIEGREGLYETLAGMIDNTRRPRNDDCPTFGRLDGDLRFVFGNERAPSPAFSALTRAERSTLVLEAYQAGQIGEAAVDAEVNDIANLGPAVVAVRVRDMRAPSTSQPGFIVGDAFIGSTASNELACSFRFFAASSAAPSDTTSAGRGLDLYTQVVSALGNATRGQEADPDTRTGGRFDLRTAPSGF